MGLIKAIGSAIGSTMKDQWLDLIKCDNMEMDTLMVKQTTKSGQISKGSRIIVAPGQAVVIYDTGQILDASAEEGVYTFDQSSSPSFFGGQFGPVFKEMWQRFTYGGSPAKEQAIFFFNLKEIMGNKFGTAAPITYEDWEHATINRSTGAVTPLSAKIRCFGTYTFRLDDLALFMRTYASVGNVVKKDVLLDQMRSEVITVLGKIINIFGSQYKAGINSLEGKKDEMKKLMDENVFDEPIRARGIRLVSFNIESTTPDESTQAKLDAFDYGEGSLSKGRVFDVMDDAAKNPGGAGQGFVGIGMMNGAAGGLGSLVNGYPPQGYPQQGYPQGGYPQQNQGVAVGYGQPQQPGPAAPAVMCPDCNIPITGNYCPNCGKPAPKPAMPWKCPDCGTENTGNFCTNCGKAKPAGPKKCPHCGAETTGKFCPNCGKPVD